MPIDFSRLASSDAADTVLHPREIFTVLRKDARYQYPRDVQAEVWEQWFARRAEHDIVLKMNTGAGKTIVGLVILKSCLNEMKGPAVYVTPDPYLTRQALAEAMALGLDATDDANDAQFRRGRSILVANIYKLINGKSVFGVGEEGIRIPIGSLVVDDAHACLAATEGQFTIKIEAPSEIYEALFALFREDLRAQSSTGVLDIEAHDPNKEMLVPYWAWTGKSEQVATILHAERQSKELEFEWPLIKDVLPFCQCVIGGGAIEISPRCLPIDVIPSFADAQRRVFMTATLADDSVLITHLDVASGAALKPITPSRANDLGDRLILIPQELNPQFDDEAIREFVASLADKYNVVVIVPSHTRSELWAEHADQVLDAKRLFDGVARLREGHVGLTVIVNKYDGIDLPDDACRVLVLDGLPDVRSKLDRIEQTVLYGTAEQTAAMVQRIEQGMGRGVRSNADYCVVILSGRSLTQQLYATNALEKLTPATRAQVTLSEQVASQLRGKDLSEIRSVVDSVLKRDRQWVDASRGALVHLKYDAAGKVDPVALAQREAFNAARNRNYASSIRAMQSVVNSTADTRVRGWLRQQLAEYMQFVDPVQSQLVLRTAVTENRLVTRTLEGIDYNRLRTVDKDQGPAAAEYIVERFSDGNRLIVETHGLLDRLKFEPHTSSAFEAATTELAGILGFGSQRPEAEYGRGPDVLWALGSLEYLVIECKNGATTETISKTDCDQLSGSANWFAGAYDASCKATAVLIHPSREADRACAPPAGMRVVNVDRLEELKTSIRGFVSAVAGGAWPPTAKALGDLLVHYSVSRSLIVQRFTDSVRVKK
jgi:hypothetical protein